MQKNRRKNNGKGEMQEETGKGKEATQRRDCAREISSPRTAMHVTVVREGPSRASRGARAPLT